MRDIELRVVEKLIDQSKDLWLKIGFSELKKDCVFRMFEITGEQVVGDYESLYFLATTDAYLNKDDIWMVDIEYLEKTNGGKYIFAGE